MDKIPLWGLLGTEAVTVEQRKCNPVLSALNWGWDLSPCQKTNFAETHSLAKAHSILAISLLECLIYSAAVNSQNPCQKLIYLESYLPEKGKKKKKFLTCIVF